MQTRHRFSCPDRQPTAFILGTLGACLIAPAHAEPRSLPLSPVLETALSEAAEGQSTQANASLQARPESVSCSDSSTSGSQLKPPSTDVDPGIAESEPCTPTVAEGNAPEVSVSPERETTDVSPSARTPSPPPIISDPSDPSILLGEIVQRATERNALIPQSPINDLSEATTRLSNGLYNDIGVRLGLNINHASQDLSVALPNQPTGGSTTDLDFILSWDMVNRGKPTVGKIYAHLEGRWDYGTRGPQNLGFQSLGSAIGTANAFSGYDPTFLLRNLYWQQGSIEAGWFYRVGRITTDAILGTSRYLSPVTTFLSNASTGFFASAITPSRSEIETPATTP